VKVDALERWDADVIGPIVDALDAGSEPYRILLLPDHANALHNHDAHGRVSPVSPVRFGNATRPAEPTRSPATAASTEPFPRTP